MGTQGERINITTSLLVFPQVQRQISSFLAVMGAGELFAAAVIRQVSVAEVPDLI